MLNCPFFVFKRISCGVKFMSVTTSLKLQQNVIRKIPQWLLAWLDPHCGGEGGRCPPVQGPVLCWTVARPKHCFYFSDSKPPPNSHWVFSIHLLLTRVPSVLDCISADFGEAWYTPDRLSANHKVRRNQQSLTITLAPQDNFESFKSVFGMWMGKKRQPVRNLNNESKLHIQWERKGNGYVGD